MHCWGCVALNSQRHWEPFSYEVAHGQLVIHSDTRINRRDRLVKELAQQRELINSTLHLEPTTTPIHVYLYADEQAYYDFLKLQFPEMANRRAIFVGGHEQLTVYAFWSEQVAEDLRHEVSHGYLHAAIPQLPLWLDEGLAEYFEVGSGKNGHNASHVAMLGQIEQQDGWVPRLERLELLNSAAEMTQLDYAESWAWVHYLLDSPDRAEILLGYLHDLEQSVTTEPLSLRMRQRLAVPATALAEHLRTLY